VPHPPLSLAPGIDPVWAGRVRLAWARIDGVTVRETSAELLAEIDAHGRERRAAAGGSSSGEVPGVADARTLYKALGLDPTKTRPSNEALLRRVLKGEPLYQVNTLVDALNLASLVHQLPFGLYDVGRVQPPIVLRRGGPGEGYEGIRKGFINLEGRPGLFDAEGPFGNPTSDSARTCITLATRGTLVVAYAPASVDSRRLRRVIDETAALLVRHCGGAVTDVGLVPQA
jgi:DNA/RNA-binding domain of Phe-tRNA-synthetase-like protein